MAEKKYSSYFAKKAATNPTAYQSLNQTQLGPNIYTPDNPYVAYLEASGTTGQAFAFQKLYRGLLSSAGMVPPGSPYQNDWQYLQALLRKSNFSDARTPIGVPDSTGKDQKGLINALKNAVGTNLPINQYLNLIIDKGLNPAAGFTPKQVDTSTKYNKQVSSSLQLKDLTDATNEYTKAYFKAYGVNPSKTAIEAYMNAFNAEAKRQVATTTTPYVTTYEKVYDKTKPIIDPKTKKPKLDANGKPMYKQKTIDGVLQWIPTTKAPTVSTGLGFTPEEQDQFLAEFLVENFPDADFDMSKIGGAAKSIYQEITKLHQNNFSKVPDFGSVAGVIKGMLSTSDTAVSAEVLEQYASKVRDDIATRFMGIADWVKSGNDASEKINPYLTTMSQFLESDITLDDNLAKQVFNFQGSDGKYRLPNEYELNQLLLNDSRYARTSTAKNESVNAFQTLANRLRIG